MTKEELRQYRYLKREIVLLGEEIERLRTSLTAAPKLDGMPKSNYAADRLANTMAKIVDLEQELENNLSQLIELRTEIEKCIVILPAEQRLLMRLRYLEGAKWEVIAVEMDYSWKQVHRIHGRALMEIS